MFKEENKFNQLNISKTSNEFIKKHFLLRKRYEEDFFLNYNYFDPPNCKIFEIKYREINISKNINKIKKINPKYIISFGSSILSENFLKIFDNKSINVHLGISPFYRGAGTNFFPIINNELEYLGVTYMMTNTKIDGGNIIHQETPNIYQNDNVHTVGNRIISGLPITLTKLIKINNLAKYSFEQKFSKHDKIYAKKDFNIKNLKLYLKIYKKYFEIFSKKNRINKKLIKLI